MQSVYIGFKSYFKVYMTRGNFIGHLFLIMLKVFSVNGTGAPHAPIQIFWGGDNFLNICIPCLSASGPGCCLYDFKTYLVLQLLAYTSVYKLKSMFRFNLIDIEYTPFHEFILPPSPPIWKWESCELIGLVHQLHRNRRSVDLSEYLTSYHIVFLSWLIMPYFGCRIQWQNSLKK